MFCGRCGLALTKKAPQMSYESAMATDIEDVLTLPGGPEILFEATARLRNKQVQKV